MRGWLGDGALGFATVDPFCLDEAKELEDVTENGDENEGKRGRELWLDFKPRVRGPPFFSSPSFFFSLAFPVFFDNGETERTPDSFKEFPFVRSMSTFVLGVSGDEVGIGEGGGCSWAEERGEGEGGENIG